VWAGVDSAWGQENAEARKMLENAAESHTSGARFVGTLPSLEFSVPVKIPVSKIQAEYSVLAAGKWRLARSF